MVGVTRRNSVKKKPGQKPIKNQPVCSEQATSLPMNDMADLDRSFDFLIHQLEYVTLSRSETFKRLSLVLAFSSFIFLLLTQEVIYAFRNDLWHNVYIIAITIAAFLIFTVIWGLTVIFLKPIVVDKESKMITSKILALGREGYEAEIHSKTIKDYKSILVQEIYAVSEAEKRRSGVLRVILWALTVLYILVIINSLVIANLEIKSR
jgi:hypothetical protein